MSSIRKGVGEAAQVKTGEIGTYGADTFAEIWRHGCFAVACQTVVADAYLNAWVVVVRWDFARLKACLSFSS